MEAVLGRRATQADGSSAEVTDGEDGAVPAAIPMDEQGDEVAVEGEGPLGIEYQVYYNNYILKQPFCPC